MIGTLARRKSAVDDAAEQAREKVFEAARAEARGKGKASGAEILALLHAAGMDAPDFNSLVNILRAYDAAETEAAALEEAESTVAELRQSIESYMAQTLKILSERNEKLGELRRTETEGIALVQQMRRAAERAAALADEHWELIGATLPDYDGFTLISSGAVIRWHDVNAPTLYAPTEIFQRESARREEIMDRAWRQAAKTYEIDLAEWRSRQDFTIYGLIAWPFKGERPELHLPTWPNVLREIEGAPELLEA